METSIKGFKNWVRNKWVENCDERDLAHQPRYSFDEYVKTYKWWLKSRFREEEEKERYRSKWRDYRGN